MSSESVVISSIHPATYTYPQVQIQTPRLLLRGAQLSDSVDLYQCFSDPDIMKYWGRSLPRRWLHYTEWFLDDMISGRQNGYTDFIIIDLTTSRAIGMIGVWKEHEIGFMLTRSKWRKGIISEALSALLPHLFAEVGIKYVEADVDPMNEASLAVCKKFGFVETGRRIDTHMIGEAPADTVDLLLTVEDWKRLDESSEG